MKSEIWWKPYVVCYNNDLMNVKLYHVSVYGYILN